MSTGQSAPEQSRNLSWFDFESPKKGDAAIGFYSIPSRTAATNPTIISFGRTQDQATDFRRNPEGIIQAAR
jgi:hypothetical protein